MPFLGGYVSSLEGTTFSKWWRFNNDFQGKHINSKEPACISSQGYLRSPDLVSAASGGLQTLKLTASLRTLYGIHTPTYIYHQNQPNVDKYIPYMDVMGKENSSSNLSVSGANGISNRKIHLPTIHFQE